ncbi:MAG: hypothetical protein KatS3mg016_1993 [Fimbriimonadales bacterium]|nr:MAG: hypothetical protein KatS3mg016_1993 [Fimbriimonadales bacterium]
MRKSFTTLAALWGILWALAQDRPDIVWMRGGHANAINSLALAPDRSTVASTSHDYTVKIWDARDGRLLRTLVRGQVTPNTVAFAPVSTLPYVAVGYADGKVYIWDYRTGGLVHILTVTNYASFGVNSVAFSPNGQTLAIGSDTNQVTLWSVNSWQLTRTLNHSYPVRQLAFSPSDPTLLASASGYYVYLWNTATGQQVRAIGPHANFSTMAFSPDGQLIVTGGSSNSFVKLGIWRIADGSLIEYYSISQNIGVNSLVFLSLNQVYSGWSDGAIRVWNRTTNQIEHTINAHSWGSVTILPLPNNRLLSAGYDRQLLRWDYSNWTLEQSLTAHSDEINRVRFSDAGDLLSAASDRKMRLWRVASSVLVNTFETSDIGFTDAAIDPNGQYIAGVSYYWIDDSATEYSGTLFARSGAAITTISGVYSLDCSSQWLATAGPSGLILWRLSDGQQEAVLSSLDGANVRFARNGRDLAMASGQTVFVWDTVQRSLKQQINLSGNVSGFALSDSGQLLATADWSSPAIQIWNTLTGALVMTLNGHTAPPRALAFSPDGEYLLSAAPSENSMRLWRLSDGATQIVYNEETNAVIAGVTSVEFSPEGRYFAYGRYDGTVVLAHNPFYRVPGDVNGDGVVDDADLLIVLFNFGGNDSSADVNGDGVVDDADLLIILFNFGSGS